MILSNNNGTFTPVAGGTGTFIGTAAAFNAVKATLPVNTVAYITDDGNGDLQPVDAVTNGDMHPVTSNAVYDTLKDGTFNINARTVIVNGDSGDLHEGGELELARPDGSTFKNLGKLYIDSYDNKLRFFGTNSSNTTTMFEIDFTDNKVRFNGNELAELKHIDINNKTFTMPTGGFVSWSNLTGLTTQPRLAYVRLTSVSIDGVDGDCFVDIKSSKYGAHAVFIDVATGLPLNAGRSLTISGNVYYI